MAVAFLPSASPKGVLAVSVLGSSLGFIDSSVVNIAMPAVQENLSASLAAVQWVSNGYMLALASLILLGGGIGDKFGTLRAFRTGLVVFLAASAACGLAVSVPTLIAARVVQGVGAALLVPTSLALVSQAYTGEARGKAIGTWSAAGGVLLALGPPLGGWLVDQAGWRSIFFINLPVGALALALSLKLTSEKVRIAGNGVDYVGSSLAVIFLGLLSYGLIEMGAGAAGTGWLSIALAVPALGIFLITEKRSASPLMPLRLFRDRGFTGANLLTVILYGGLSGGLFMLPFALIRIHHYAPTVAGLAFVPFSVILGVGSRFSGGLASKYGPRLPLIAGPLLTGAGFLALGLSGTNPNYWLGFFPGLVLIGLGMTLAVPALTTTVFDTAPDADSGAASGINNAAARTGGLLAVAGLGIAFGKASFSTSTVADLADAYRTVMFWAAAGAVLSAVCAAGTIPSRSKPASAR